MNPKTEFIKAIMSVLRLELNIYTTGAIEMIVDRIDMKDYQIFIAYLGERESNYEKPIESIAKGVDEFYKKKFKPIELSCKNKAEDMYTFLLSVVSMFADRQNETELEISKKLYSNPEKLKEIVLTSNNGKKRFISEYEYLILESIGFEKIFKDIRNYNVLVYIREEMVRPYRKRNISEMIEDESIKHSSEVFEITSDRVKQLMNKNNRADK